MGCLKAEMSEMVGRVLRMWGKGGTSVKLERMLGLQWRKPERERERVNSKGKAKIRLNSEVRLHL